MANQLINIRSDKFSKKEILALENSIKEWNYDWIVDIVFVGEDKDENLDATFTLKQDNLGEFLWVIFGCGFEFSYQK